MNRYLAACSLFAIAGATLPASQGKEQEDARGRVRCFARLADGSPWHNASITLLSRPIATHNELEGWDTVRVRTSDRGVARAELLPGRSYSCWASSLSDEKGHEGLATYRISKAIEGIRAGDVVQLGATKDLLTRYSIRVDGLDAWKKLVPFTIRVVSTGPMNVFHEKVTLDQKGTFWMPEMPGPSCFIQVFGKNMYPILQEPVPMDSSTWKLARANRQAIARNQEVEGLDPGPEGPIYVVSIPPPAMARVEIKDQLENVIGGATLFLDPNQSRSPWYKVAQTDKQGRAEFPIAAYRRKDGTAFALHLDVLVRTKGVADGWATQQRVEFAKDGSTPFIPLGVAPGFTGRGSLLLKEGKAVENHELILFSSVQRGKGGGQIGIGPYRFRTKQDGSFELPGRSGNYNYRLCTQLSPEQIGKLGFDRKYPTASLVLLASAKGSDEKAIDLQLDRFIPVEFQILDRDGSPAADSRLYVGEVTGGGQAPHYPLRYRPNRRGRLRLLFRRGSSILIYVVGTEGAALEHIDIPLKGPLKAPLEGPVMPIQMRITLNSGVPIRGQVLDARGNTVRDAFLILGSISAGTNAGKFAILRSWATMSMLAKSSEGGVRTGQEEHPNRIWRARQWRYHAHPSSFARCSEKGGFEFWFPKGYSKASIEAIRLSKGKWLSSKPTTCKLTGGAPEALRLVIEE